MIENRSKPLEVGVKGDSNLFGFVVTLNFEHGLLKDSPTYDGSRESTVPENVRDHHSTLTHEGIHFFHALSTSYLYRLATDLFKEVAHCRSLVRAIPASTAIRLPLTGMEGLGRKFAALGVKVTALSCPQIPGISALDIIEGAAVYISYRFHLRDMGHDGLLERLRAAYGSGSSPYCDAFRLADWYLGEDLFEVFSPMCFLALCSADPGLTYCRSIEILGKSGILHYNKHPSFDEVVATVSAAGIDEFRTAFEEIEISGQHPILTPYINQLSREFHDFPFKEFFARPYEFNDSNWFEYLVPPLVRYDDGHGIVARKLPTFANETSERDRVRILIHFTATGGAALAMASPADYYMQCPHTGCPHYRLRLCHAFAPIPKHYRECGFPDTFESVFQRPLQMVERG